MSAVPSLEHTSGSSTPAVIYDGEEGKMEENGERRGSAVRLSEAVTAKIKYGHNPFKLPRNADYAKVLEEERHKKTLKFKKMQARPVHEKIPAHKMRHTNVMDTLSEIPPLKEYRPSAISVVKDDPDFLKILAKGEKLRNLENLNTFIKNKREMFHTQYMIGIKRDAILRLIKKEETEEAKLSLSEKWLEDDAIKFSDFLRLNDREAVEAVKSTEMETKTKLEKVSEIKKLNVLIVSNKSKISKLEDLLTEYKLYGKFLTAVAPEEWKVQKQRERMMRDQDQKARAPVKASKEYYDKIKNVEAATSSTSAAHMQILQSKKGIRLKAKEKWPAAHSRDQDISEHRSTTGSTLMDIISELQLSRDLVQYLMDEEDEEKADLYFTEPEQLAGIFTELQEQTLFLIQKNQETEEALEEVTAEFEAAKKSMKTESKLLRAQVATLERMLDEELKKGARCKLMAKMTSFGIFNEEVQQRMIDELGKKIAYVYTSVMGPNVANLNAMQMMISIETEVEDLLEQLETLPSNKVDIAIRNREKQRRKMARTTKVLEQERLMQARRLRTMEKADRVKRVVASRKLMPISTPPVTVTKKVRKRSGISKSEEDHLYFFS